jgi:hypothetical protein
MLVWKDIQVVVSLFIILLQCFKKYSSFYSPTSGYMNKQKPQKYILAFPPKYNGTRNEETYNREMLLPPLSSQATLPVLFVL